MSNGFVSGGTVGRGLVWRPRMITLPGGDRYPLRYAERQCGGGVSQNELTFFSRLRNIPGGQRGFVNTDPTPYGFYLWLPYLSLTSTDNNGQALDLYLGAPSAFPNNAAVWSGVIPSFPLQGFVKLLSLSGTVNDAGVNTNSQGGRGAATGQIYGHPLTVPSGFFLHLTESNSVVSGIDHTLEIRYFYLLIPNGTPPPQG